MIGKLPTGKRHFGLPLDKSVIRLPLPIIEFKLDTIYEVSNLHHYMAEGRS